jgi:putative addiction module killer protein
MIELRGYVAENGNQPFADWFDELDAHAAARIAVALTRMGHGNFSTANGVGAGVYEYKIDFGPGHRIYFAKDGDHIVILLGGGTKASAKRHRNSSENMG